MKKRMRNRKGFTLIELIVVIAILGILAAIMIPRFTGFQDKARQSQAIVDAKQVATAIDSFYAEKGTWPSADSEEDVEAIETLSGINQGSDDTDGFILGSYGNFTVRVTVGDKVYVAGREGGSSTDMPGPVKVIEE